MGGDGNSNTASLIRVNSGGRLILESGAVIRGNFNSTGNGGGVYVAGGNLTMNSGEIRNNWAYDGGGVYTCGGTFVLTGGVIAENTALDDIGGGVAMMDSSTFIMTGGSIQQNEAYNYGGGVWAASGVVFIKTGGTIYGVDSLEKENISSLAGSVIYIYYSSSLKRLYETVGEDVVLYYNYDPINNIVSSGAEDGWNGLQ